jgi:hypothetical protein
MNECTNPWKTWKQSEKDNLRKYYGKIPTPHISFICGHTIEACYNKAFHMGLCINGKGEDYYAKTMMKRIIQNQRKAGFIQ